MRLSPLLLTLSFAWALAGCGPADPALESTGTDPTGDSHATPPVDDTSPPADTGLPAGTACDPSADPCAEGLSCCTACCEPDATPVCTPVDADGACPLPDLEADVGRLESSMYIEMVYFEADACALVEGCVDAPGWRRLLRFDSTTPNYGTADLKFGDPEGNPLFVYSECHDHMHFDGYARYRLLAEDGSVSANGHKQAFCLEDYEPWADDAPRRPRYTCDYQGIQMGWADTYGGYLDCQWIDITDVDGGTYTIESNINPDEIIPEKDYGNNVATATVDIPAQESPTSSTDACPDVYEGPMRDCGWLIAGNFVCTPGEAVSYGCDGGCDGACQGDPIMRICDGVNAACDYDESLGNDDDERGCGHCPVVTFTCPESGTFTVLTGEYDSSDGAATCEPVQR
jgi:hypothetical protein